MAIRFNGGQYLLDTLDIYTQYGFVVTTGKKDFLQYPKAQERYSYVFPGEATQYDLSAVPNFEDPQINLKGYITAATEADFLAKRAALFAVMKSAGAHTLKNIDSGLSYQVFYLDSDSDVTGLRIKGSNLKAWELTLILQTINFDTSTPGTPGTTPTDPGTGTGGGTGGGTTVEETYSPIFSNDSSFQI